MDKKNLQLTSENSSESGTFIFSRMTTERMYSITGTVGMMVYATDLQKFFYYNGVEWLSLTTPAIDSIIINGSTGLAVTGSPIEPPSGTVNLILNSDLQFLSQLASTGILVRTGSSTYALKALAGTSGQILVTDGDGVAGNPTFSLATTGVTAGSYTIPSLTVDVQGRISTIIDGNVPISRLENYPSSNAVFLRGDGTWIATPGIRSLTVNGSTGLSIAGSPVTSDAGIINLTLGNELQSLSGLSTTGFLTRTGSATYSNRTLTGTAGQVTVTNGDGISGNPVVSLIDTTVTPGSYTIPSITVDSKGRLTAASDGNVPIARLAGYPADATKILKGDGSWGTSSSGVAPGVVEMFAGPVANIPFGYLYCNGNPYSSLIYPALYSAIGKAWGSQDITTTKTITGITATTPTSPYQAIVTTSAPHTLAVGDTVVISGASQGAYNTTVTVTGVTPTTFTFNAVSQVASSSTGGHYRYGTFAGGGQLFNLPDGRGYFPRGFDDTAGYDPDKLTRTGRYTGGNTGNNVGSYQADLAGSHTHTSPAHNHNDSGHQHSISVSLSTVSANDGIPKTGQNGGGTGWFPSTQVGYANIQSTAVTINPNVGSETRPKNFYVNFIIKY